MTPNTMTRTSEAAENKSLHADGGNAGQHLGQVVYTPNDVATSGENNPTMVLMVDTNAYQQWRADKSSIAIANVVDSFEVLKYDSGRTGLLNKPSKAELQTMFNTTKQDQIVEFIMEHGELHHKAM